MTKKREKRRDRRATIGLKRLAKLQVRSSSISIPDYSRDEFGSGWADNDGDGQNERAEVLIAAHRSGNGRYNLEFASERERRVVSGRWRCRFSGEWYSDAGLLDIDHLVPLAEAWASGAYSWTKTQRVRYSNGVGRRSWRRSWLLPVDRSLNRSKGAQRPDEWLPPNTGYQLHYAAEWIATKQYWDMTILQSEHDTLAEILNRELR